MTSEQRKQLDECLNIEDGLTDWEVRFLDDLDRKDRALGGVYRLSKKQAIYLEKIHREKA